MPIEAGTVTVMCKVKPKVEEQAKGYCTHLIAPSRAEEGYIAYDWQQSTEDPRLFLLYMQW